MVSLKSGNTTNSNHIELKERINHFVSELSELLKKSIKKGTLQQITKQISPYSASLTEKTIIGEEHNNKIAAFLFYIQVLTYELVYRLKGSKNLPELIEIQDPVEIYQKYFPNIEPNLQFLYKINILKDVDNTEEITKKINELLNHIKNVSINMIKKDVAGRLFHHLLPRGLKKVLAAYYSHPVPADLMARLALRSGKDLIVDMACGSGTLLISSYIRKKELLMEEGNEIHLKEMQKNFLTSEIMGFDIVPFAAELSLMNLYLQYLKCIPNNSNIFLYDALFLSRPLMKAGNIKLRPYNARDETEILIQGESADTVLINPPYTQKERMPKSLRESLNESILGNISGHGVNLWGYFLVLGHLFLKQEGRLGAIIPINFIRGRASKKIRSFYLKNYQIKFVIKPVNESAFSEDAKFRDIIIIAEKKYPTNNLCGIGFFKGRKDEVSLTEIKQLTEKLSKIPIKESSSFENEIFETYFVSQRDLQKRGISEYLWASNVKNAKLTLRFYELLRKLGKEKLKTFNTSKLKEGFHTSPGGISQLAFMTDPKSGKRTARSFLLYEKQKGNFIYAKQKDTQKRYKIPKSSVKKGLRTNTGLRCIDISELHDYLIIDDYPKFDEVLQLSKFKRKDTFHWGIIRKKMKGCSTNVTIFRRFSPYTKKTALLSFFSEEEFIPTDSFKIYRTKNIQKAKMLCLFLNSTISLLQFLTNKQETTGIFSDIKEEDLADFLILNYKNLTESELNDLVTIFDEIKDKEFPPLMEQIFTGHPLRRKIDEAVLRICGFAAQEIEEWTQKIYNLVEEEMKIYIKATRH